MDIELEIINTAKVITITCNRRKEILLKVTR